MRPKKRLIWTKKTMGTDYYPEQWDSALWESDLTRMRAAGISVIRIAEFAWNKLEPEDGVFTYGFFDRFLDLCADKGMKVIFGTPTATPPAWLSEKYPEILNCDIEGNPYRHGSRRHYTYNSPVYQKYAARIVEREAVHYGKHPAICGWQIDNELNCETADFYSEADNAAFRVFLQEKYGSLEELNRAWGTAFWNETYTDWSEVHVIRKTVSGGVNPHQHLDYLRFVSDSCIRFAKMQADIIRRYKKPGDFVTTNGMFGHLDNCRLQDEVLDVYTYDSYPNFAQSIGRAEGGNAAGAGGEESLGDRDWSRNLSVVRSVCPHFGIMEQQAGPGGWTTKMEQASPRPGQLTLWAMQSVAHGADYVGFFRWRTACAGTEIYWHGILDWDNRDNRRLAEVKEFYKKLRALDETAGADCRGFFGVLQDVDNQFDAEVDCWHGRVEAASRQGIFAAAQKAHVPGNVVPLSDETDLSELASYPVLFYPHAVILDEKRAAVLRSYVEQGGTLVIGCRTGYKDLQGHCVMQPQPGLLSPLTGTTVKDFSFACPGEDPIIALAEDGRVIPMPLFNDVLEPGEGTRVLAAYANGYFQGEAALTEHRVGAGRVLHLGSTFCRENTAWLLCCLHLEEPLQDMVLAPDEVELALQEKEGKKYLFVLNYGREKTTITLIHPAVLLYTGRTVQGDRILPPFGTAVYRLLEERERD